MNSIRSVYVEKKEGFNSEAVKKYYELKSFLKLKSLKKLRILNRYVTQFLSEKEFSSCFPNVFSDPAIDEMYTDLYPESDDDFVFIFKSLPGQFDQKADSAALNIKLITRNEKVLVESAKVYIFEGSFTEQEKEKIKEYCINPVESIEISFDLPENISLDSESGDSVEILDNFISLNKEALLALDEEYGFAMNLDDLLHCQAYFCDIEKRNPTITEMKVLDTYWSDHCRHTTFLTKITDVRFEDGFYTKQIKAAYDLYLSERGEIYKDKERDISLMDIAVLGMKSLKAKGKLDNIDESEEINACSIVIPVDVDGKTEEWLLMFKNETHNHPTEIEPFGGASTCLGGCIRDPLSGRSYVYQAMRITGSGNPLTIAAETLAGKLPQRKITTSAAEGYSSYGNQIGIASGYLKEIYDDGYVAKRMELGAVISAVKKENVVRDVPAPNDIVLLVGGKTGRDGCGGATGSSKKHTEESSADSGAEVQKGNPLVERNIQRLFRNPKISKTIKRCNDFGAGGVSVAIGELADGLIINLDAVPTKYNGLDGTELAISESQERMAVVLAPKDVKAFILAAESENLEATEVAIVTEDKRLIINWKNNDIVNISREFLDTNGVKREAKVFVSEPKDIINEVSKSKNIKQAWLGNLEDLNVASQKGLIEMFDSTVGAATVLAPLGGKFQLTPSEVMAAKIPVQNGNTTTASLMSYGYNPMSSKWSPFHGAIYAVTESVSKIVAAGGNYCDIRLTFQEYFESLGKDEKRWGKPFAALLGAFLAQMKLDIPSIGGKDSMSGTFNDIDVPPTLVSFAVNIANVNNIISNEFKNPNSQIIYLEGQYDNFGIPNFDYLKKSYNLIIELIKTKKIISAHVLGFGGISAAISKMCFGNKIGAKISLAEKKLFSPCSCSFVVEYANSVDQAKKDFSEIIYEVIGETNSSESIIINDTEITLSEALRAWTSTLETVFPTSTYAGRSPHGLSDMLLNEDDMVFSTSDVIETYVYRINDLPKMKTKISHFDKRIGISISKPQVFIPIFPGTNGEYDMERAFAHVGGKVEPQVIRTKNNKTLSDSVEETVKIINNSQIIAIPGGAAAGDEPDGAGKYIANYLRNSKINEAIMELLEKRNGLILGIGNGFQALVRLGLLPFGQFCEPSLSSLVVTSNTIGRHVSVFANTIVRSVNSPWLTNTKIGDVHTLPYSAKEGRVAVSMQFYSDVFSGLENDMLIPTLFVDDENQENEGPFGFVVESLTSADGKVFGKMGHSERIGNGLYKNITGNMDQGIFDAGIKYFQ